MSTEVEYHYRNIPDERLNSWNHFEPELWGRTIVRSRGNHSHTIVRTGYRHNQSVDKQASIAVYIRYGGLSYLLLLDLVDVLGMYVCSSSSKLER